jgi:L-threonylcarbamoyladenylate synthase
MNREEIIKTETVKSISFLKEGGTLLYPTDTIWGIGCDALNTKAVEKVYAIKNRPAEKSMIILVHDVNLLMKYVKEIPDPVWDLVTYSERPLTVIYPGAINLPREIIAADGSIAIRVVKDGFAYHLMNRFNRPLISTSANASGAPSPMHFADIAPEILGGVDYVVALQAATDGPARPSTIMQVETNGKFKFIRR